MSDGHGDVGLDIALDFKLELGRLSDSVDKLHRELARRKRLIPMHYDAVGSAVCPASGICVIDLSSGGLPSTGRLWEVKRWAVGSVGVQAATGQAWLFVTGQQAGAFTSAGALPIQDLVDASTSGAGLPWGNTFGTRQVMVTDNERLLAVIIGGTNGATYNAGASVDDFPLDAELGVNQVGI